MYFLSEEEKRMLLRRLMPQAREKGVAQELRGWNWDRPPLSPIYGIKLGVSEIASKYCPTNRDVYLRRVLGVKARASARMIEGNLFHGMLAGMVIEAKRIIYNKGAGCLEDIKNMPQPDFSKWRSELARSTDSHIPDFQPSFTEVKPPSPSPIPPRERKSQDVETAFDDLKRKGAMLWEFEKQRIYTKMQDILTRQPRIGADSLVALVLPVTVEQRLDGSFLGLSSHLSADAFAFSEPMMMDIKFGDMEKFHRLSTTGYAMVMESLYEYPVNVGCVVYVSFRNDNLNVERDFHLVDDELRQWFIEERDERMRMVQEEIDPGIAKDCGQFCPYFMECHPV